MLRGCIGTIEPTQANVALEVIQNAISAATQDPRFPPIVPEELADLDIKVDVLGEPEPVDGLEELDPKRYGVIVKSARDWRRGLLLPDLEGVDTVESQVDIARRKAGIRPDEPIELYRFEVVRYT
jgi:AmmeMemoRadiSam system protein A